MAQIAAFSLISPMEAANYRQGNLLSPPRHSSFALNSHSSDTRNPRSVPPYATIISQAKHQPKTIQIQKRKSTVPAIFEITNELASITQRGEHSTALALFNELQLRRSIRLDLYTFNIAINCYCCVNRVGFGFSLLGGILKLGYVPDEVIFTTLLNGLISLDKTAEAVELFKKIVKQKGEIKPDVANYGSIMNRLCKMGNTGAAIRFLMIAEEGGLEPNKMVYSTIINRLCKQGMIKEAEELLEVMEERGVDPDVVTYSSLMDGYCLQGRMDEALRLLNAKVDMGLHPDTCCYNILINGYCKNMKLDEAMHLFEEMPLLGLERNIITFTTILQGLVQIVLGGYNISDQQGKSQLTTRLRERNHTTRKPKLQNVHGPGAGMDSLLVGPSYVNREGISLDHLFYAIEGSTSCNCTHLNRLPMYPSLTRNEVNVVQTSLCSTRVNSTCYARRFVLIAYFHAHCLVPFSSRL